MTNYERIEKAIVFIKQNFKEQPNLEEIAKQVYLSPFHFQRIFKDWAGVTPKKFVQFLSINHAKQLLKQNLSLLDAAFETGLSGSSRLHDLFITIEGMTPGEYKNGGEFLCINYSFTHSPFGEIIIASTHKGICHVSFIENRNYSLKILKSEFPNAIFQESDNEIKQNISKIFLLNWYDLPKVKLHLKGTEFQLKVWEALLNIPFGSVSTYSNIANKIKLPKSSRVVGNAVAHNPVAYLIPCHRVIKSNGEFGNYHWGPTKKEIIIGWENAKLQTLNSLIAY